MYVDQVELLNKNFAVKEMVMLLVGSCTKIGLVMVNGKMVNGFRYYRALESVSMIASALSTALTIYPCQIRVHQR